jgi:hypothetical protein
MGPSFHFLSPPFLSPSSLLTTSPIPIAILLPFISRCTSKELMTHTICRLTLAYIIIYPNMYYATSRKVAGSIPYVVIGFFSLPNPSSRKMSVGSTQPK